MGRGVWASIDLDALQHNLTCVRTLAPRAAVMAMIKSNAYGHGIERVVHALHDAEAYGVACLDEALCLRQSSVTKDIVLMSGFTDSAELLACANEQLTAVIHDAEQLKLLMGANLPKPLKVWLKVDTGMHRLGFLPACVEDVYKQLAACSHVQQPIGLMTHFASADDPTKPDTTRQIECFRRIAKEKPSEQSLANSAGILAWPEAHRDWVRPGLMLYGVSPFVGKTGEQHGLKPVMTLTATLIAVRDLQQGDVVGYGGTWCCPEPMRVGVVSIGYGDGYPRHAESGTPTVINGKLCPLIGRVSMDMVSVDLRPCPQAEVGDKVELWGKHLPVETVAGHAETIAYELLCNVSQRVKRVYNGIR